MILKITVIAVWLGLCYIFCLTFEAMKSMDDMEPEELDDFKFEAAVQSIVLMVMGWLIWEVW